MQSLPKHESFSIILKSFVLTVGQSENEKKCIFCWKRLCVQKCEMKELKIWPMEIAVYFFFMWTERHKKVTRNSASLVLQTLHTYTIDKKRIHMPSRAQLQSSNISREAQIKVLLFSGESPWAFKSTPPFHFLTMVQARSHYWEAAWLCIYSTVLGYQTLPCLAVNSGTVIFHRKRRR